MPVIIFIATLLLAPFAHAQPVVQATLLAEQAEGLAQPHDAALSPDGKLLYVTDMANSRIVVLDAMTLRNVGAFGKGARHFDSHEALIEALQDCLHADMTVLVKGSRGTRTDVVVDRLVEALS